VRLSYPESEAPTGGSPAARPKAARQKRATGGGAKASVDSVTTPMQGTVLKVLVTVGQQVAEGDVICIVEAMKMENEVAAHRAGEVTAVNVIEGQAVQADEVVAIVA
jgi:acetyl-CoA/propionyl-CoA carboxylase, biotin carboxylase, biotin carboxyl carrier protein